MLAMAAMAFLHGDVNLSIFCTACAGRRLVIANAVRRVVIRSHAPRHREAV